MIKMEFQRRLTTLQQIQLKLKLGTNIAILYTSYKHRKTRNYIHETHVPPLHFVKGPCQY